MIGELSRPLGQAPYLSQRIVVGLRLREIEALQGLQSVNLSTSATLVKYPSHDYWAIQSLIVHIVLVRRIYLLVASLASTSVAELCNLL